MIVILIYRSHETIDCILRLKSIFLQLLETFPITYETRRLYMMSTRVCLCETFMTIMSVPERKLNIPLWESHLGYFVR
jgi:hypothetical protein